MSFFGEKLKELRQVRGWKQDKLAEILEVSQALISQFEKGQRVPTPLIQKKLSEIFEVESNDFFPEPELEKNVLMRKIKKLGTSEIGKLKDYVEFLNHQKKKE